jgi:hypothetical protein
MSSRQLHEPLHRRDTHRSRPRHHVILGGWVRLSGTDSGKPFAQKARFADIWHKGPKGWQLTYTQVTLADKP